MADTAAAPAASSIPSDETPNQRLARQRREKRQKRTAEEGEDRLAKIKALNGGIAPPAEALGGPTTIPGAQSSGLAAKSGSGSGSGNAAMHASVEDPDEADIDTVSGVNTPGGGMQPMRFGGNSQQQQQQQQQDPLAALFGSMQGGGGGGAGGQDGGEQDPMLAMMQQLTGLMGGNPQNPNDPNQPPQIPPMLQALMGGGGGAAQAKAPATGSAYIWRIAHALFALLLASYVALTRPFSGSEFARVQSAYLGAGGYDLGGLFTLFITAELVLQGSRFVLEKGQLQGSGWLATVANSGFVPEPYAQVLRTGGRWLGIAKSVVSDALVVVFVFGVLAWWSGSAAAF
ncbi:hypothetical protein LTR08_001283 [Meristemomyces frigidus]|nr:hypothetical protein LTR08_001283 [Meristemomyces frigidus]